MKINGIENIIAELKGQFGIFYREYLYQSYERLSSYLDKKSNSISCKKDFVLCLVADMVPDLINICIRTLLAYFYEQGESRDYDLFYKELGTEEGRNKIYLRYPVLKKLVNNYLQQRIAFLEESINNFENDKKRIINTFGFSDKLMIESIRITSGDTHNGGRKVIRFVFNEGELLYKPRSLAAEHLFYDIQNIIGKDMPALMDVSEKDHSWQELAAYSEAETIEDVKSYFFKFGQLLFVADMINSHDIHRENIIARKNGPVCIDLETLIDSGSKELTSEDGPIKNISMECINSVLGTLMLPTNSLHMVFDFDVSAISGRSELDSDRWYDFVLVDKGSNSIRLEKTYKLQGDENENNLLKFAGKVVNPRDYVENILEGFGYSYNNFCEHKNEIIEKLKSSTVQIRQVLRPTAIYGRFLQASLYSEYLANEENYDKLFQIISNGKNYDAKHAFEINDLINRDVPYFYSIINEKTLYCKQGKTEDYFERSSLEVVLKKIDAINEGYFEKQKYYINLSLTTLENTSGIGHRLKLFSEDMSISQMIEVIAKRIENRIFWNVDHADGYMLSISEINDRKLVSMLNYNLYESGGILLFLAALYYSTGKSRYLELTKGLFNACISTKAINATEAMGVYVGKMSYVYVFYFLYKYLGFTECEKKITEICIDVLNNLDAEKVTDDIISGLAGIVVLLVNILNDGAQFNELEKLLDKAVKMLYGKCQRLFGEDVKTGFAHGFSGIALAMYKAYEYYGEDAYLQMSVQCSNKEDEMYDSKADNWADHRDGSMDRSYWCYGAAGIALSRKLSHRDCKVNFERIKILSDDNHSLCHGQMGNLAIIEELTSDSKEVEEKRRQVLDSLKKEGVLLGNTRLLEDYSFMQGLSGIGYELIRMENKNLPNILALEV